MTAETQPRIWFHPPKFWAATRNMRKEEREQLLAELLRMAENAELDRLRLYSFISVGPFRERTAA